MNFAGLAICCDKLFVVSLRNGQRELKLNSPSVTCTSRSLRALTPSPSQRTPGPQPRDHHNYFPVRSWAVPLLRATHVERIATHATSSTSTQSTRKWKGMTVKVSA
jgi:hypothetical protein